MVAQPASVPAARRVVDDALTAWGRLDLVDDVGLSVTELATNATLHSQGSFFDVELLAAPEAVRVAVVDGGGLPADSISSRVDLTPAREDLELESMTGRGLFIVSALATRWGIDDLPTGTRVWADFRSGHADLDTTPPQVTVAGRPAVPAGAAQVIRLLGCPPDLLLAHDDNLADLARELRLFGASHDDRVASGAATRIADVVRAAAISWDAARLVARQAVAEGRAVVDVAFAVTEPDTLPVKVQVLRESILAAEQMADQGLLMTLPASTPVQLWRDWVQSEMTEQVRQQRAPRSFRDYAEFR
jgi:anti-sigma regulatory factor (Ser/Thr protein kinase)